MRRRHLDLGESMSTWSSQGEGRPCTWSLPDRGFLAGTLGAALWHCKGRQEKQTFCPQAPLRPEASLGKTRQRSKGLCGVSCSQMLMVLVIPRAAQIESRAASLPVGAGARITSALI